jgi:spore germination protein GerM
VAKRKNYGRGRQNFGGRYARKSTKARIPGALVFWAAFFILIAGLFFINRDHIRETLENTRLLEKISPAGFPKNQDEPDQPPAARSSPRPVEQRGASSSAAETGPAPETGTPAPAIVNAPVSRTPPPVTSPEQSHTEQVLYFIRVDDDGEIIRSKALRRIPVSGTLLQDTLKVLIAGPNSGETSQGMISLVPPDTRILSAVIDGNTARVNFSEEFQYNTAGMEGFIAQLIQIVWTATEFPNVQNVQILIEGNRIDHLGEGIPIWNPLNRQSF